MSKANARDKKFRPKPVAKSANKGEIVRPYSTHYFTDTDGRGTAYSSTGASSSEQGAIRAAIVRLFLGQYKKAVVYDRFTGLAVYNIKIHNRSISVGYGAGVEFKGYDRMRWSPRGIK